MSSAQRGWPRSRAGSAAASIEHRVPSAWRHSTYCGGGVDGGGGVEGGGGGAGGTAGCVTLTPWPATVAAPARSAGPVFAPADRLTLPFPVPDAGPIMSQSPPLVRAADQLHDASLAVIVTMPGPPPAGSVIDGGPTVNVHTGA